MLQGVQVRLDEHQIGAGLDWQETPAGNVDTVSIVEMTNGGSNGSLKLDNRDIRLALLVGWDGLVVWDDLHLELVVLHNSLDGLQVQPDVVGIEVLEFLDRLELVDVLLWHLSDFKKAD